MSPKMFYLGLRISWDFRCHLQVHWEEEERHGSGYSIDFSGPRLLSTLKLDCHSYPGSFVSRNLMLGLTVETVGLNKSNFPKHSYS